MATSSLGIGQGVNRKDKASKVPPKHHHTPPCTTMGIPLPCTPTQVSAEELASILVKGKEKETSTKGVAAPKGQYDNPMGSSSSNKPGEEGGDMTKRKRQTKEEETNKDKPAKAPYPNRPKTTVQGTAGCPHSSWTASPLTPFP